MRPSPLSQSVRSTLTNLHNPCRLLLEDFVSDIIKSSISVKRSKRWLGAARKVYVVVDDQEIGVLKNGERKVFSVSPGTHKVFVRFCKIDTKPINVNIKSGEHISLKYNDKSQFGIIGLCILGLMMLIATIVLESFNIPFTISLIIATLALSPIYKILENKKLVPPAVVIDGFLDTMIAK